MCCSLCHWMRGREVKAKGGLVASSGSAAAVDGEVISGVSGKLFKTQVKKARRTMDDLW